jgi:hypothetical protein
MTITFEESCRWVAGLDAVMSKANVDGRVVRFFLEGRALADYFGTRYEPTAVEFTYMRNYKFLNEIVADAIRRGMFNRWGEVLLGKKDLTPYFEKRDAAIARA